MKIYGVFDPNRGREDIETLLDKMSSQLNPEKYWKSGNFVIENFGVGHIYSDVTVQDSQPVWNENHTKLIAMVGKIFDYETKKNELITKGHVFTYANSDAEFVLHGIEEWGEKFLRDLNGFFIFALYDITEKSVLVVNDRFGAKPFYYYFKDSVFVFASEVKAVIKDDSVKKEINWEGWRDIFSYGFLLGTKTLFTSVHALPPAAVLKLGKSGDDYRISLQQYWNYSDIKVDHDSSEQYFIEKGAVLLKQAILRQTEHMKECIVLLSGGYDSRFIASAIRQYTDVSFETMTTVSSDAYSLKNLFPLILDPVLASEIARVLKIRNTFIPKIGDSYNRHLIEKVFLVDGMSLEHHWFMPLVDNLGGQVNFDGLAGDVLLRGGFLRKYNLPHVHNARNLASILDQQLRQRSATPIQTEIITDFFDNSIKEKLEPRIDSLLHEITSIKNQENIITIFAISNRTKNAISLMPNNIIGKRAICFFPFLDKDLLEFSLTIPKNMRTGMLYVQMLTHMFPEIMQIPSTNFRARISLTSIRQWTRHFRVIPSVIVQLVTVSSSFRKKSLHLLSLLDSLSIPPFVDVNKIKNKAQEYLRKGKNPLPFLDPITQFCIWYDLFCTNKIGSSDNQQVSIPRSTHSPEQNAHILLGMRPQINTTKT
jgi:asparagine synthase (glutamine-hydrolysing)